MTPAQQTKIELVVEAIEAMTLAQVVATSPVPHGDRAMAVKNVADARECLAKALAEFLQPNLRIVERIDKVGEASTTLRKTEVVPYEGRGIDGMNLA